MPITTILSYAETGSFSGLLTDYMAQKPALAPFYHRFPSLENFAGQIKEKKAAYTPEARKRLISALRGQYGLAPDPEPAIEANLLLLGEPTTFTVTTGHQLSLLTGPLYFIYKIVTAIKLARDLKAAYPQYDFVPVYWMATEDHDFAEINHFSLFSKMYSWDATNTGGPVGRLSWWPVVTVKVLGSPSSSRLASMAGSGSGARPYWPRRAEIKRLRASGVYAAFFSSIWPAKFSSEGKRW